MYSADWVVGGLGSAGCGLGRGERSVWGGCGGRQVEEESDAPDAHRSRVFPWATQDAPPHTENRYEQPATPEPPQAHAPSSVIPLSAMTRSHSSSSPPSFSAAFSLASSAIRFLRSSRAPSCASAAAAACAARSLSFALRATGAGARRGLARRGGAGLLLLLRLGSMPLRNEGSQLLREEVEAASPLSADAAAAAEGVGVVPPALLLLVGSAAAAEDCSAGLLLLLADVLLLAVESPAAAALLLLPGGRVDAACSGFISRRNRFTRDCSTFSSLSARGVRVIQFGRERREAVWCRLGVGDGGGVQGVAQSRAMHIE